MQIHTKRINPVLRYTALMMRHTLLTALLLTWFVPAWAQPKTVQLLCEAVYLPGHKSWQRSVEVAYNQRRLTAVRIDGLPVYSFNVQGNVIITALDNERIQIDVAQQSWRSDFRGLAQSQGRCERKTP